MSSRTLEVLVCIAMQLSWIPRNRWIWYDILVAVDALNESLWLWDEIANGDSSKLDFSRELKESMTIVEERKVESLDNARHETLDH